MTVVVDASLAAAWLLPDEGDDLTDRILDAVEASGGVAPSIFRHEVRNIILVAERRKRITSAVGDALLIRFARLPVHEEGAGDDVRIFEVARTYNLTAYDSAYLTLALSTGRPVATLDRRLAAGAHAAGLTVLGRYAVPTP